MSGYMIESKPLTPSQAQAIMTALDTVQVRGFQNMAAFLTAMSALERIANGIDAVSEIEGE